jgi:hypothetical protein
MHRHHGALGEVDDQTGSQSKLIQDVFSPSRSSHAGSEDYQGVVRVLEDGTRCIISKRVAHDVVLKEQPLHQITHQQVQVRGKGVSLAQSPLASDPVPRDSIQ